MSQGFRRNFDAEAVARARGDRPKGIGRLGGHTTPSYIPPVDRLIVIPAIKPILSELLAQRCAIKPVAADWHIDARDRAAFDAILSILKLRGVHGVLKRKPRPSEYSGR